MNSTNQKIDYLKEDQEIPGQSIALVSMVEPTNSRMLMNRESLFATRFLKGFLEEYTQALTYKIENGEDKLTDMIKEKLDISYENIKNQYYEFQKLSLAELESEFNKTQNTNGEPTVTGFKVRGVFPNQLVAAQKAKELQVAEQFSNIFALPVGKWVPYCPLNDNDVTPEFQEEKLNELVKSKIAEADKAKIAYEEDKIRRMEAIAEENEKQKSQNKALMESEAPKEEQVETVEINDEDLLEILESDDEEEKPKKVKKSNKNKRKQRRNNRRKVNRRRR